MRGYLFENRSLFNFTKNCKHFIKFSIFCKNDSPQNALFEVYGRGKIAETDFFSEIFRKIYAKPKQ